MFVEDAVLLFGGGILKWTGDDDCLVPCLLEEDTCFGLGKSWKDGDADSLIGEGSLKCSGDDLLLAVLL